MKSVVKWVKRVFMGILGILVILLISLWVSFKIWKQNVVGELPGDSQLITTQTGEIEYVLRGKSGNYILSLHGTPGSCQIIPNEDFYIKSGYSIIAPSRPGYFRTPSSAGKTSKEQADAFASLLDELGIDSVIVSAFSGSGPIGIEFAINHSNKCKGLILTSAITKKLEISPKEPSFPEKILETEFGFWLAYQGAKIMVPDSYNREDMSLMARKGFFPFSLKKDGKEIDSYIHHNFSDEHLDRIKVPTLIIHGDSDNLVPYKHAQHAHSKIPNSELLTLKGKNHFFNLTSFVDTVNIKEKTFLESIDN